jgi:hypothetical protein
LEVTNGIVVIGWRLRALLIVLAALASSAASADDDSTRWSLGMQLGQAHGNANQSVQDPAADLSTMSYDMSATVGGSNRFGWRVFTGYRFNDYLAIHVGYTDLGESKSRFADTSSTFARMPTFERAAIQTVHGIDAGLQLKVPVSERVWVDVHAGRYFWRSQTRMDGVWNNSYGSDMRTTQSDSNDFFGAGLEVGVMHDLSATVSWTHYQVGSDPVALWTVGALYRFGFY